MKHWTPFTALAVLVAAVALAGVGRRRSGAPAGHGTAAVRPSPAILGVEALMQAPERHQGPIRVEGIVSAIAPKQRTLALIDIAEFQKCRTVQCAPLALPVRWTGPMPAVANAVRVEGEIRKLGGKLIFVARALGQVKPQPRTR
jgi:hypothetical protein